MAHHDPDLDKLVRPYTEASTPLRKQPVSVRVTAREGAPLATEWRVGNVQVALASDAPLGAASQRAIDEPHLRQHLGRLGNTPYELASDRVGNRRPAICAEFAVESHAP